MSTTSLFADYLTADGFKNAVNMGRVRHGMLEAINLDIPFQTMDAMFPKTTAVSDNENKTRVIVQMEKSSLFTNKEHNLYFRLNDKISKNQTQSRKDQQVLVELRQHLLIEQAEFSNHALNQAKQNICRKY